MLDLGPDVLSRVVSWALRGVSLGCLGDLGGGLLSFLRNTRGNKRMG